MRKLVITLLFVSCYGCCAGIESPQELAGDDEQVLFGDDGLQAVDEDESEEKVVRGPANCWGVYLNCLDHCREMMRRSSSPVAAENCDRCERRCEASYNWCRRGSIYRSGGVDTKENGDEEVVEGSNDDE